MCIYTVLYCKFYTTFNCITDGRNTYLVSCILYLVSCILYLVSCILYLVSCILYLVSCILYLVSCILYLVSCILYLVSCILYLVSCILYLVSCILYLGIIKEGMTNWDISKQNAKTEKARRWLNACGRKDFNSLTQITNDTYICSIHFVDPIEENPDPIHATSLTERSGKRKKPSS